MKLLVDMNLGPDWLPLLAAHGWEAQHWSNIGQCNAPDTKLMSWAREHGHVVLTQDLDFPQQQMRWKPGDDRGSPLPVDRMFSLE